MLDHNRTIIVRAVEGLFIRDSLDMGHEEALCHWDNAHRAWLEPCDVCEDVFHYDEMAPSGPLKLVCASCAKVWR